MPRMGEPSKAASQVTKPINLPPGVGNRLSEKTLEIDLGPRELAPRFPGGIWFGLTHRQESANGYDAAVTTAGAIYLFQYRVSTVIRSLGARQFRAPHTQVAPELEGSWSPRAGAGWYRESYGTPGCGRSGTAAWEVTFARSR